MNNRHGFTLIELSVVLIVIGLLTAGILMGQDLMMAAQVRRQVSQIEQLNTAVNVFRMKYGCIPGDCNNFQSIDTSATASDNGNFDGQIGEVNRLDDVETVNFWRGLSVAKLVNGDYPLYSTTGFITYIPGILSPKLAMPGEGLATHLSGATDLGNKTGGVWVASKDRYTYGIMPGVENSWFLTATTHVQTWFGVYRAAPVYAMDIKMDDGHPTTGTLQVVDGFYQTSITRFFFAPSTPDACINNSVTPFFYNLVDSGPSITSRCGVLIKASF